MEGLLLNGMPDKWTEVIERDGSAIGLSTTFGHFMVRRASKQDLVVSIISDLDAQGKLAWRVDNEEDVRVARSSAVFRAELPGTGWSLRLHILTHTRATLGLESDRALHYVEGNEVVNELYHRLLRRFCFPTRSYVAPEIEVAQKRDEALMTEVLVALASFPT